MHGLLIDTNVWIDLAGNFKEQPLLLVLEEIVRDKKAELVVPSIVKKEFEEKKRLRDLLSDMGQKYPLMGEVPKFYVSCVQALLDAGTQVEPSADVLGSRLIKSTRRWRRRGRWRRGSFAPACRSGWRCAGSP
jgi:hypothetical protein